MNPRSARVLARLVGVLTVVLSVGCLVLAIAESARVGSPSGVGDVGLVLFETLAYSMLALVGAVVAIRQPRNACGWLLLLIAAALALNTVAALHYRGAELRGDATGWLEVHAAWIGSWVWILAIVPAFIVFPLLFPTGRPLSSRWGRLVWIALAVSVVLLVGTAFTPGPLQEYPQVVNPYGINSAAVEVASVGAFFALVPIAFVSIASVALRFRRATGVERQQIKWVAVAALLLPLAFMSAGVGGDSDLGYAILLLGLVLMGAAVGVAMLRYRLYDLDVVINRTLVYGALTAILISAYVGGVLLLQLVLSPVTESNELAVAGSTLAVAALFRPARTRVQSVVDRRFARTKYDAARTLAAFGSRVRDQVDLGALSAELRAVVHATMHPAHVTLWVKER